MIGGIVKRVPVRTSVPLKIEYIHDLLHAIYDLTISAPLPIGTAVVKNFAGTGVDVITTRHVRLKSY